MMILIKRYFYWLAELSALWAALLLIVASILIVANVFPTERGIRIVGLFLQVVGICAVLVGIEKDRKDFNLPPIHATLLLWCRRAPWIRQKSIHGNFNITAGLPSISALCVNKVLVGKGTIEERIRILEELHNSSQDAWAGQVVALQEAKRELLDRIESERAVRELTFNQSSEKLKDTILGGIGTAFAGSLVLLVGVVMSTSSPELSRVFS